MRYRRYVWQLCRQNFILWKKNPRIIFTFVLTVVLCLMLTDKAMVFSKRYHTSIQMLEPFVWAFGDAQSLMLSSFLLILLFMDMPFIHSFTPYYLFRMKRSAWIMGQILYVLLATVFYAAFLLIVTCLLCSPNSFAGNVWSETGALLGYSGVGAEIALPASVKVMELSTPYTCAASIFLLLTLYLTFLVTLMMAFNICRSRFMGVVSVFAVNFYGLLLNPNTIADIFKLSEYQQYIANALTGWLSPLNHATYYMHNFGYDYLPRLWMSCVLFLLLILLNVYVVLRGMKKYEFEFLQKGF